MTVSGGFVKETRFIRPFAANGDILTTFPMTTKASSVRLLALLAAFVLIVFAAHLLGGGTHSALTAGLRNALHAPGFLVFATGALLALRKIIGTPRAYTYAAGLCFAVAAASEGLQYFGSRDAELHDFARDMLGTGAALITLALFDPKLNSKITFLSRPIRILSSVALAILVFQPVAWLSYALAQKHTSAPMILGFDQMWEKEIYAAYGKAAVVLVSAPSNWNSAENMIARITSGRSKYSGIEIEPFSDWSDYDTLSFTASSTSGQSESWTVRIHDRVHNNEHEDRFTSTFQISEQPKKVLIPLDSLRRSPNTRLMDLQEISSIIIFANDPNGVSEIYLDDLRLN